MPNLLLYGERHRIRSHCSNRDVGPITKHRYYPVCPRTEPFDQVLSLAAAQVDHARLSRRNRLVRGGYIPVDKQVVMTAVLLLGACRHDIHSVGCQDNPNVRTRQHGPVSWFQDFNRPYLGFGPATSKQHAKKQ